MGSYSVFLVCPTYMGGIYITILFVYFSSVNLSLITQGRVRGGGVSAKNLEELRENYFILPYETHRSEEIFK